MSTTLIRLSKECTFEARKYAILKAAILGLPDSGKSYSAMKLGEELLDNKIPIVVLDPVGIWHNLKNGIGGKKGYEVIVAGGEHADIPLTVESASKIMYAAMVNNIPIIFDLHSIDMAQKSKWISVLTSILEVLLYNNKKFGQRHLIIEEAGEFCPQRIMPQHAVVYGWIEKLTRIGRNMNLGVTFINQRAADINKSILENCNITLLHAQDGRNSLKHIKDWLEAMRIDNRDEIMKSIPNLEQGQCWVLQSKTIPVKIQVDKRKTIHPNPEAPELSVSTGVQADVSRFIKVMNQELQKELEVALQKKQVSSKKSVEVLSNEQKLEYENQIYQLNQQVFEYAQRFEFYQQDINKYRAQCISIGEQIDSLKSAWSICFAELPITPMSKNLMPAPVPLRTIAINTERKQRKVKNNSADISVINENSIVASKTPGKIKILVAAREAGKKGVTLKRLAILAVLPQKVSTFRQYMQQLRREGLIMQTEDNNVIITPAGMKSINSIESIQTDSKSLIGLWCQYVGNSSGKALIFRYLANTYPEAIDKIKLANQVKLNPTVSTYRQYLQQLSRLGIIVTINNKLKAADELFQK